MIRNRARITRAIRLAATATLLAAVPLGAAPPAFVAPQPVERTLENGLRVVVFEDARLPIAQVQLLIPAGLAAESESQPGIAHMTGQMIKRGTPTRDAARFWNEMGALGADLTISTLRDYTALSAGFLSEDLQTGLDLVADAVINPLFSNEEGGRLRLEVARTLIDLHTSMVATAEEQLWPFVLEGHVYGRTPAGTVTGVLQLSRDDLKAFHDRHYRPGGSVLAVAGAVKAAEVFEAARTAFSGWQGTMPAIPSMNVGPGSLRPRIRIIDLPTGARTELRIVSGAPERGSRSSLPFAIGGGVFSEIAGSRLSQRRGWPGVSGSVTSGYTALRDAGLFIVRAAARTDSVGAAIVALTSAIADFSARPPDAAETEAARMLQRASWPMASSTLSGLLLAWGDADFYGLGPEALRGHAASLDTLDATTVGAVVSTWIDPARLSILAVGPAEALKAQLEPFGEVEVVRLDDSPQAAWATDEPTEADHQRGRAIVDAGTRAHGGIAALRSMKDSSIDASIVVNAQGREVTGRMRQARKEPFRFREVIAVFVYENEQVLAGNHGWVYETRQDRVLPADTMQVATMRSNFLSDLPHQLLQANEAGAMVIDRGQDQILGRTANVVEVRLQSEEKQLWLLFDAETDDLVASDIRGGIPPRILARRIFSDFRKVKDLRLPFAEARYVQGAEVMRIEVSEMGYNLGVADAAFGPPVARD